MALAELLAALALEVPEALVNLFLIPAELGCLHIPLSHSATLSVILFLPCSDRKASVASVAHAMPSRPLELRNSFVLRSVVTSYFGPKMFLMRDVLMLRVSFYSPREVLNRMILDYNYEEGVAMAD
jgi:hypothetical protein